MRSGTATACPNAPSTSSTQYDALGNEPTSISHWRNSRIRSRIAAKYASRRMDTTLEVAGREVAITNPDKVYFPTAGYTKLDLAKYYADVAEGALRGIASRPIVLKRYVNGADQEPFFQKRAPDQHPDWIETVELRFPSGRTAREIVIRDAAQLL